MELRNWIESELKVSISIVGLTNGLSIAQLTELLLKQLSPDQAAAGTPNVEPSQHRLALTPSVADPAKVQNAAVEPAPMGELSDRELDRLLAKMLTE
jgi:hypothetical protein